MFSRHTFASMIKPMLKGRQVRRRSWRKGRSIGFIFNCDHPAIYDQDGVYIYDLTPADARAKDWEIL